MVDSEAFAGNLNRNPFNFRNFNISEISVSIEGEHVPYQPFKFDFKISKYLLGYYTLFTGVDWPVFDIGNDITLKDYKNGYMLLALDLSLDSCGGNEDLNLERTGNLRINFRFETPLQSNFSNFVLWIRIFWK